MRPRRLKLVTPVDSGQIYRVYQNQAAPAYSSFYFFIFLPLQFSNIEIFRHTFLRNCEACKVKTWYTRGQCADVLCLLESGCTCILIPLFLHFSFSPIFEHWNFFVTLFLGTVRPRRLKLGTHMDSGQMYRVYQNQAASAYSSFYFFIFLSLSFSSHFSQELWGLEGWNLVHTWTVGRCIVYTESGYRCLFVPLFLHFSFSQFSFFLFLQFLIHNTLQSLYNATRYNAVLVITRPGLSSQMVIFL